MGGKESSSPETSRDVSISSPESFSGDKISGAPMRVLVFLHKAFRGELNQLRRAASDAADEFAAEKNECRRKMAAVEIRKRLEFFRSVFRYHCAAEDEVTFFLFLSPNFGCVKVRFYFSWLEVLIPYKK